MTVVALSDVFPIVAGNMPEPGVQGLDGKFPEHIVNCGKVARDMIHAVMVEKGLATADSPLWQDTLPELMNMTPDAQAANGSHKTSSDSITQQGSMALSDSPREGSNAEASTTGSAGSPRHSLNTQGSTARRSQGGSNGEESTAGSAGTARSAYGGEPGEQWAGSQSPDQVVSAGMAAAADMEAAAQGSDVGPLQKIEEGSLGSDGLSANSDEQGQQSSLLARGVALHSCTAFVHLKWSKKRCLILAIWCGYVHAVCSPLLLLVA